MSDTSFDKSAESFPVKENYIYLNNCGIAPLYAPAEKDNREFMERRVRKGVAVFFDYGNILGELHQETARLLNVKAENISFMKNTAEGLSIIANGYPFRQGDEVISYVHEYPSNHYPWLLQEKRGVKFKLIPDADPGLNPEAANTGRPRGFRLEDLEKLTTDRTRMIAVSHVQFTSGFAADLPALGNFCRERGIDLVVDAAQSLGSLPVLPEEWNISAVAASGWKWLMGPVGSGLLYTSPEFRAKLSVTMAGAEVVVQGEDYLNHAWQPHTSGELFEYSTTQVSYAAGLKRCFTDIFSKYGIQSIRDEIFRLQDLFLSRLDQSRYQPVLLPAANRSGILSLICPEDPEPLWRRLSRDKGLLCTSRGDYLRIAPHFYNDDDEVLRAADILNEA